eukprot:6187093-Pleurochrysis_carterae.AAC.3
MPYRSIPSNAHCKAPGSEWYGRDRGVTDTGVEAQIECRSPAPCRTHLERGALNHAFCFRGRPRLLPPGVLPLLVGALRMGGRADRDSRDGARARPPVITIFVHASARTHACALPLANACFRTELHSHFFLHFALWYPPTGRSFRLLAFPGWWRGF